MAVSGGKVTLSINTRLVRIMKDLGGTSTPEMTGGARVLKKEFKKVLGVKGNGKPAPAGEPPRKQKGDLQESVVSGVVGVAQRVGMTSFVAPLQQFGVDTKADGANPRSRRDLFTGNGRDVKRASKQKLARKVGRRAGGEKRKVRDVKIPAHPFVELAVSNAQEKIVDLQVSEIRRRLPGGF